MQYQTIRAGSHLNLSQMLFFVSILVILWMPIDGSCYQLELVSPTKNQQRISIFKDSQLSPQFNDTMFNKFFTCENGQFIIIDFERQQGSQNGTGRIIVSYEGIRINNLKNIFIQSHFPVPLPVVQSLNTENGVITFRPGCLGNQTNKNNYFNKIDIKIQSVVAQQNENAYFKQAPEANITFSFLLGCAQGERNKKFELGYIFIALINAAITIGVALHSKIWSLRLGGRPLSFQLKWHRFLIIVVIVIVFGVIFFIYAADQFTNSNLAARYLGLIIAYIFVFICTDQILFLIRVLKKQIGSIGFRDNKLKIRLCDIGSLFIATVIFVIGFFTDNWIFYDVLAIAICVGAIKLLRFSSMKQAYLSMLISIVCVTTVAIILHFTLQRSYNDYGSQLSSPLFLMFPDMVEQLYKKCSWLPTLDVIVPGVFLSFLRTYDQNYNTGWGGVYTVIGNLSFISSTVLWVILEAVYPYSIPFSLITYSILGLSIYLISLKRNEIETLWEGRFNGANNDMSTNLLRSQEDGRSEARYSFSKLVGQDIIDAVKINNKGSEEDEQQQKHKNSLIQEGSAK